MKNKSKRKTYMAAQSRPLLSALCAIALAAITGFSFTACGGGGGGGGPVGGGASVAANFRFRNAPTNAAIQPSANMGIVRSVAGLGGVTYQVNDASFSAYTAFYNTWLGGDTYKVGAGITPTKFIIPVFGLRLYGHNSSGETIVRDLIEYSGSGSVTDVDFAQGITINLDDIPPGTYTAVQFSFSTNSLWNSITTSWHYAKVEFPWPADLKNYYGDGETWHNQLSTHVYYIETEIHPVSFSPPAYDNANPASNKVTTDLQLINTGNIEFSTGLDAGLGNLATVPSITDMFFFGNEYKLYASNFNPAQHIPDYWGFGSYESPVLAVPFTTITIPEGAESVTFEIRWDLTGIVQQYKGRYPDNNFGQAPQPWTWLVDNTANDGNDVFVLKNNYWEGLSITATVQ